MSFINGFSAAFTPAFQRGMYAQQEQENRDRQFALEKERHDADMKERGLRIGAATRVNDATNALTRVQQQGIQTSSGTPTADLETASIAAQQGLQMPDIERKGPSFRKATDREVNTAMIDLAAARGDMGGLAAVRGANKKLDEDDLIAKATFNPELSKWVNLNSGRITVGKPDKNGFTPVMVVQPDGEAVVKMLSEADKRILAGADAIFDINPDRALQMAAGVDKALADALRAENLTTSTAVNANNDVTAKGLAADEARARTGIARAGLGLQQQQANRPVLQQFIDATGQPVLLDMNKVPVGKDGRATLPEGVKFPRQTFTPQDILRYRAGRMRDGAAPEDVDREVSMITTGADPVAAMLDALKKQNAAGAKPSAAASPPAAPAGPDQGIPRHGLPQLPQGAMGTGLRDWWNGGRPQRPLLDFPAR